MIRFYRMQLRPTSPDRDMDDATASSSNRPGPPGPPGAGFVTFDFAEAMETADTIRGVEELTSTSGTVSRSACERGYA
eukprot:8643132-Pyramimonas_sp.AAC.1